MDQQQTAIILMLILLFKHQWDPEISISTPVSFSEGELLIQPPTPRGESHNGAQTP